MEMQQQQQPINHLHPQHLPFLPNSHPPTATDFDAVFAGVSLQSLLLGEPVLLTPPPPPFPTTSPPALTLPSPLPLHHFLHRGLPPHQLPSPPPPAFFFQAAPTAPSEKKRHQPRRNHHTAAAHPHPQPRPPRRQRQKVSDKLKALRRMVPCDHKADIATMLEQAYKYVRYLEAQVLALMSMKLYPLEDRGLLPGASAGGSGGRGESDIERRMVEAVGRLSRKEVVEAVVNSRAAQRVMYEEGLCLVSEEQVRVFCLSTFQKQKQQQLLLQQQQQLLSPGNNNLNNTNDSSSCSFSYN